MNKSRVKSILLFLPPGVWSLIIVCLVCFSGISVLRYQCLINAETWNWYVLHLYSEVLRKPCNKDIVMPAHAYAWRTPYAILCRLEISQVSNNKNRHNVSLNLPTMYDVPPSPGLTSAANIRISKIKNNKLTFFFWKNYDFKIAYVNPELRCISLLSHTYRKGIWNLILGTNTP